MMLWDCASCYEHLPRPALCNASCENKFPNAPFNLSLCVYSYQRWIDLQDMVQFVGYPRRGGVAGDAVATYHCLSISAKHIADLVAAFLVATINLYVDDLYAQTEEDTST